MSAVVIGIPHSSIALPPAAREALLPRVTEDLLLRNADAYTDRIYGIPSVRWERFAWHRFLVDPNRTEVQQTEGGVVPTRCFDELPLYAADEEPDEVEQRRRVLAYHRPYHQRLAQQMRDPRTRLYIDGHSMTRQAPRRSPDFGRSRPDACLSNNGWEDGNPSPALPFLTCSPALARFAVERLSHWLTSAPAPDARAAAAVSGEVRLNDPFQFGHGVRTHAAPGRGVPGIQVEFNQRLWVDEDTFAPLPGRIEWLRLVLDGWLGDVLDQLVPVPKIGMGTARFPGPR